MKSVIGFVLGIIFILCIAAAVPRYYPAQPKEIVYTMPADPNDQIYNGLSLNTEYVKRFGNHERTIVFYNIALNSARIKALEAKMNSMVAPKEPNEPPEATEPNEPNIGKD